MPSLARLILPALLAALVPASAAVAAPRLEPRGSAVPAEAIVRFEPGTDPAERAAARDAAGVELEQVLRLPQAQVVSFEGPPGAALARLERRPGVAYAQPNYRYEALAPDDSFFGSLWGLGPDPGVGALAAWDRTRGAGQVIAIVDSGIDLTHPDLSARLWQNPGETAGGGDGDANGRVDDVHGFDFVEDDGDPDDYQFHGTHVAGTAAATADNGAGVAGVAPEASLMAVRVLDGNGGGTSADVGSGIVYAAQEGADVINLSLGGAGGAGDVYLKDALAVARSFDAVVVAAAGNEGNDNDAQARTPCALPGDHLICVAALSSGGTLPGFSNYGATTVDVAAPGTNILSTKTDWGAPLLERGLRGRSDRLGGAAGGLRGSVGRLGGGPLGRLEVGDRQPGCPLCHRRLRRAPSGLEPGPERPARLPHALRPALRRAASRPGRLHRPVRGRRVRRRCRPRRRPALRRLERRPVRGSRGHDLGARRPRRRPALLRARERREPRRRRCLRRRAACPLPRLHLRRRHQRRCALRRRRGRQLRALHRHLDGGAPRGGHRRPRARRRPGRIGRGRGRRDPGGRDAACKPGGPRCQRRQRECGRGDRGGARRAEHVAAARWRRSRHPGARPAARVAGPAGAPARPPRRTREGPRWAARDASPTPSVPRPACAVRPRCEPALASGWRATGAGA